MSPPPRTDRAVHIHRGEDRGVTSAGWLDSRHSFSFGQYRNPSRMGYRSLRVLNDDRVAPGAGFAAHPHHDMEILSWVLTGGLAHGDSTGRSGVIRPGELQVMSAGSGIRHSERNASTTEPVHFLQIWIEPARDSLTPSYDQRAFDQAGRRDQWQLLTSGDDNDTALHVNQDARLFVAELSRGAQLDADLPAGRYGYLHVATGAITIEDLALTAGDAISFDGGDAVSIRGAEPSQVLLFDLG